MYRFFSSEIVKEGENFTMTGEDYNHLKNALRIRLGQDIELTDPLGKTYLARLESFGKKDCLFYVEKEIHTENEPNVQVNLFMALLKGDRMDSAIQKSIECGVSNIIPLSSQNTIVDLSEKNKKSRYERWNRIAKHASMQCKRDMLIEISPLLSIKEAIDHINKEDDFVSIVCHEKEDSFTIKEFLEKNNKKKINIFIGPEGGFTQEEIQLLNDNKIESVSLGKRVLRADTACATSVFFVTAYSDL